MAHRNAISQNLGPKKRHQMKPNDPSVGALAKQVIGTRYPVDIHALLMEMPSDQRQAFIRAAVAEKLERA